jgi:hypothetical protein
MRPEVVVNANSRRHLNWHLGMLIEIRLLPIKYLFCNFSEFYKVHLELFYQLKFSDNFEGLWIHIFS